MSVDIMIVILPDTRITKGHYAKKTYIFTLSNTQRCPAVFNIKSTIEK